MTGFASVAFPSQANGSLDQAGREGRRLAARGAGVHRAALLPRASVGDRAGLQRRRDDVREPRARRTPTSRRTSRPRPQAILKLEGPYNPGLKIGDIPVDAVTTSASGIDPDISPANAALQSRRVAAVRHVPLATVQKLIRQHTDGRSLGFFGEPGVNVLELNLALDKLEASRWRAQRASVFSRELVLAAIRDSFPKLDPRLQLRNPVMFIVELGSVITTGIFFLDVARGAHGRLWFVGVIAIWLWLTVLFANFAEAIAEGRGKAQANALRATRTTTNASLRDGAVACPPPTCSAATS